MIGNGMIKKRRLVLLMMIIILLISVIYHIKIEGNDDNVIHEYLYNINKNYVIHDIEVYDDYELITFTCPKGVLGCLLVQKTQNQCCEIVTCRYGKNVDYLLVHYNADDKQFVCIANTGIVKKVIVRCDQKMVESFDLNKNGISSNLLNLKARGESWEYTLLDENGKVLE